MPVQEGKAIKATIVPANYDGGLQEGDTTPIYIDNVGGGIPLIDPAVAGNLAVQTAGGELVDGGVALADVALTADTMPKIDPAVAGNLVVQTADGTLVDAGYAASTANTPNTVVRRTTTGQINVTGGTEIGLFSVNATGTAGTAVNASVSTGTGVNASTNTGTGVNASTNTGTGVNASAGSGTGVNASSVSGTAAISTTSSGTYHHAFGTVSAIARTTGALTFVGASADANRLAQTNEIQAVSFGAAQTLSAPEQAQARANIGATDGAGFMPVVNPATANRLVKQLADGTLVDAGMWAGEIVIPEKTGGAIGQDSEAQYGGAVGFEAATGDGAAVGNEAVSVDGAALGGRAKARFGGAVGWMARTLNGFAGGNQARTETDPNNQIDAIQLGTGTNPNVNTLQIYTHQLLDASGNIPSGRMTANAVLYGAVQTLTAPEQEQARTNIGIGGGWSGSFATGAGQTVTVLNGIITNVV